MTEKTVKPTPDWVIIERDYRAGIKPLRQIAEEHGITHGAVNKRAKKDGWSRDLAAKVAARAEEKVSKAAVSTEVSRESAVTEKQVIEANAELQYQIRIEHRQDIKRARSLFGKLLGELEEATDRPDLLEELFDLVNARDEASASADDPRAVAREEERLFKLRQKFEAIMSIAGRVDAAKKLGDMLEKLIKLEREAFGIKSDEEQASPIDELLHKIAREREAKA